MPFNYREHRGGLDESMQTQRPFESEKELFDHVQKTFPEETLQEIKSGLGTFDDRIGELSIPLLAKFQHNFGCIGFTDQIINKYRMPE